MFYDIFISLFIHLSPWNNTRHYSFTMSFGVWENDPFVVHKCHQHHFPYGFHCFCFSRWGGSKIFPEWRLTLALRLVVMNPSLSHRDYPIQEILISSIPLRKRLGICFCVNPPGTYSGHLQFIRQDSLNRRFTYTHNRGNFPHSLPADCCYQFWHVLNHGAANLSRSVFLGPAVTTFCQKRCCQ